MRDAVTLEALGIPTVILVNDVFGPIAHATAALLKLPAGYVRDNIVWLPHPTSNLTPERAAALIDDRMDDIRAAFLGERRATGPMPDRIVRMDETLETARAIVDGLAESLRADGADLVLLRFENGTIEGEVRIGDVTCDDGACIMPADALARMVDAMLRPKLADVTAVVLHEIGRRA